MLSVAATAGQPRFLRGVSRFRIPSAVLGLSLVLCWLGGAAYLFVEYRHPQVEQRVQPASYGDLDGLNRPGVFTLTPGEAMTRLAIAFESAQERQAFIASSGAEGLAPDAFGEGTLHVQRVEGGWGASTLHSLRLIYRYEHGLQGAALLEAFTGFVIAREGARIAEEVKVIVANRVDELDARIFAARLNYEVRKKARIAGLLEADTVLRAQLQDELQAWQAGRLGEEGQRRVAQINRQLHQLQFNRQAEAMAQREDEDLLVPGVDTLRANAQHLRDYQRRFQDVRLARPGPVLVRPSGQTWWPTAAILGLTLASATILVGALVLRRRRTGYVPMTEYVAAPQERPSSTG